MSLITIILLAVCMPFWALAALWFRRAAKYNEIRRKLYAREPLTGREQRLLDKARDRP